MMIMKRIYFILMTMLLLAVSCDKLPLQKGYDYNPKPLDPYQGVTCWEYIAKTYDLSLMKRAVQLCGLTDLYSQEASEYTYLLLDDKAFESYVVRQLGVSSIDDADTEKLRDILLFHIIKGEYSSYNGLLGYESIHVLTLWNSLDAVMTIKLNNDKSLSSKRQDKVTLMDQCGSSTVIYARTSDLLMTNGPAHILSRNCVYVK